MQAGYTTGMDRVRLGRALGYGTRQAAKTVAAVVEAASAPAAARSAGIAPGIRSEPGTRSEPAQKRASPLDAASTSRYSVPRRSVRAEDVGHGFKHLKRSVWQPLAVFSGALWLRVTGLFFGLIAFTVGAGAWRLHGGWQKGLFAPETTRFWLFVGVTALFAYFAASSFVRANLKERRARSNRSVRL